MSPLLMHMHMHENLLNMINVDAPMVAAICNSWICIPTHTPIHSPHKCVWLEIESNWPIVKGPALLNLNQFVVFITSQSQKTLIFWEHPFSEKYSPGIKTKWHISKMPQLVPEYVLRFLVSKIDIKITKRSVLNHQSKFANCYTFKVV